MLAIKNNLMSANAARHLGDSYNALAKSVERLSSGKRINSAKDDAAGLAVSELMRADVAVLQQGDAALEPFAVYNELIAGFPAQAEHPFDFIDHGSGCLEKVFYWHRG